MTSPGKGVGGLPPRRVDQVPVPPPAAVSPGSSNVVRARLVIVSGADDGVFVYDGTPAANNLIASIAAEAGTDSFGNDYPAGIAAYNDGDTYYVLLGNNGFSPAMQMIFQNIANPFSDAPFVEALGSGSAGTTLELNSGSGSGGSSVSSITLQDSTAAGRANGLVTIDSGGLSGPALLSSTDSFQGPLTLPLPHQSNNNTTLAGVLAWSNNLTTNLIASGLMS